MLQSELPKPDYDLAQYSYQNIATVQADIMAGWDVDILTVFGQTSTVNLAASGDLVSA